MRRPQCTNHQGYRPDIDGLRAIAVLAVIGYHFFPTWVRGGFIGVDIFFVISGFLISSILITELENNRFSLSSFYAKRIRRIFPALLTVLFSGLIIGWLVLLADEYSQLGKHITASAGFLSNFLLLHESGYFDIAAEAKPLLHLWSLGIEEQFYLIWPCILWVAWRMRLNLFVTALVIATTSFTLSIKAVQIDATVAFYSPQTRFWELLIGGLLASAFLSKKYDDRSLKSNRKSIFRLGANIQMIATNNLGRNILSLFGFALIVTGTILISRDVVFPGYWALMPTLGAALIISSGKESWPNRVILSNKILVGVGVISYPLYLWHWLLLAMARNFEGELPSRNIRLSILVGCFILSWLTYRFVEKPIRFGGNKRLKTFLLLLLMTLTALLGLYTHISDGFESRARNQEFSSYLHSIKRTERQSECFEVPFGYKKNDSWFCELGVKSAPTSIFAYGDSHALSLVPALEKYALSNNTKILFTGTSGCPSLLGIQSMRRGDGIKIYNCKKLNERVFEYVRDHGIKSVILVNRWVYYTGSVVTPNEKNYISRDELSDIDIESSRNDFVWALENTISRYAKIGVKVYIVEDTPRQIVQPRDILVKAGPKDSEINKFSTTKDLHLQNQSFVNREIRKYSKEAKIINFDDVICPADTCLLSKDSEFLYFDADHLSVSGALFVYPTLKAALQYTQQ